MKRIGILGGGQLALMMLPPIQKLGFSSVILDQADSPCDSKADEFIKGDYTNPSDCLKLKNCDVVTIEIENISLEGLRKIKEFGCEVYPSIESLELIKDKGRQKELFRKLNIPTGDFSLEELSLSTNVQNKVVKLRQGGYDGKGVWIPKSEDVIPSDFLNRPCVIESQIDIKKELAVVGVRSTTGEIKTYEMVEMVMDPHLNLLDYQINPADVSKEIQNKAESILRTLLEEINYVGVLAVEFFLDRDEKLWVNELAPRVHNSGHNTIESAPCSQFENHIRAISGLALGETSPALSSLTMNLIGSGDEGETLIEGRDNLPSNTYVHFYNKKFSRPGRKMGHVTLLGSKDEMLLKAKEIKENLKIIGKSL